MVFFPNWFASATVIKIPAARLKKWRRWWSEEERAQCLIMGWVIDQPLAAGSCLLRVWKSRVVFFFHFDFYNFTLLACGSSIEGENLLPFGSCKNALTQMVGKTDTHYRVVVVSIRHWGRKNVALATQQPGEPIGVTLFCEERIRACWLFGRISRTMETN